MLQPDGVIAHPRTTAQLQSRDADPGLADHVKSQPPFGRKQSARLPDRAGDECGLITTGASRTPPEPPVEVAVAELVEQAVVEGARMPRRPRDQSRCLKVLL